MPDTPDQPAERPASPKQDAGPTDSTAFLRCASCGYATDVDPSAGTLVCRKHNMLINAEADELPDDCPAFEPKAGSDRPAER